MVVLVDAITRAPSRHIAAEVCSDSMAAVDRVIDLLARKFPAVASADLGQIGGNIAAHRPLFRLCTLAIGAMTFGAVLEVIFAGRRLRHRGSGYENKHE